MFKSFKKLKNVTVIAPHPDDEAIGCSAFFEECLVKKLIVITDGGVQTIKKTMDKKIYIAERKKESLRFALTFGVKKSNVYFLEFPDGQLNKFSTNVIFEKINKLINKGDSLLLPSPRDIHADHRKISQLSDFFNNEALYYTVTGNYSDSVVIKCKKSKKHLIEKFYPSQYWRLNVSKFKFRPYEEYKTRNPE